MQRCSPCQPLDVDGRLHRVGRAKELVIRGGFKVYRSNAEAPLNAQTDAIKRGVMRRHWGGNLLAFVQWREPAAFDTAVVVGFAAARLTGYKKRTQVVAVGRLPAGPTGKILKHWLLDAFADGLNERDQDNGKGHERDGT